MRPIQASEGIQRRSASELRAATDDFALIGYAAKYNSMSKDLGGFREVILRGAFARSLTEGADVKCTFNHAPDNILGRTQSGTLSLSDDSIGLHFRCQLDRNQTAHRDLYSAVKRGDITECSFAFTVAPGGQQWEEGPQENGQAMYKRTLTDVDLIDVAAVVYPAYPATAVAARSNGRKPDISPDVISTLRKATRAMAESFFGIVKRDGPSGTGSGDEMALVREHMRLSHELLECSYAMSDTARSILDGCDPDDPDCDDEDRARARVRAAAKGDEYFDEYGPDAYRSWRGTFDAMHAGINQCCNDLANVRMQHERLIARKKKK